MAKEKAPEPPLHIRVGMALGETFEFGGGMWWRTTPTHSALLPHRYDGEIISALDALNKYWRSPKRLGGPGAWSIHAEGDTKTGEYTVRLGSHVTVIDKVLSTAICRAIVLADESRRKQEARRVAEEDQVITQPSEKASDQQTTDLPARDPAVHGPGS